MYSRKARFFQQNDLDYPEIGGAAVIAGACRELAARGVAESVTRLERDTLPVGLACLTRSQLALLARQNGVRVASTARRETLLAALTAAAARPLQQRTLDGRLRLCSDTEGLLALPLVRLCAGARAAFDVLFGVHTLQPRRGFQQMLLSDLTVHTYPAVALDTTTVVFPTRAAYDALCAADALHTEYAELAGARATALTARQTAIAATAVTRLVALARDDITLCVPAAFSTELVAALLARLEGPKRSSSSASDGKEQEQQEQEQENEENEEKEEQEQEEEKEAREALRTWLEALVPGQTLVAVHTDPLARFTAGHVYHRIVHHAVAALERARRYAAAAACLVLLLTTVYGRASRGAWWLRLSVDLAHLGLRGAALEAARHGLHDPAVAPESGDILALRRRVTRLTPSSSTAAPLFAPLFPPHREVTIYATRAKAPAGAAGSGRKSVFCDAATGEPKSVELVALSHYLASGAWTAGMHSESGVFRTLFALLLWDETFDARVPAAFLTPWQQAPLDIAADTFYASRRAALDARLAALRAASPAALARTVAASYTAHRGTACLGVAWTGGVTLAALESVARAFPGRHLAAVLELMARDTAAWSAGLPDLLLWRDPDESAPAGADGADTTGNERTLLDDDYDPAVEEETQGSSNGGSNVGGTKGDPDTRPTALLVEVKGPGDRLSCRQAAWLGHLVRAGVNVEVCHVRERSAGARARARPAKRPRRPRRR